MSHLKYIEKPSKTGKTKVVTIKSSYDDNILGQVSWLGQWRAYVFFPSRKYETFWSFDCLNELSLYIFELNLKHHGKK
jgi:hypothetical protein